jgi:hypothetical protein
MPVAGGAETVAGGLGIASAEMASTLSDGMRRIALEQAVLEPASEQDEKAAALDHLDEQHEFLKQQLKERFESEKQTIEHNFEQRWAAHARAAQRARARLEPTARPTDLARALRCPACPALPRVHPRSRRQ